MDAEPSVDELRESDVIAGGGDELFDAVRVLVSESDDDDAELLNCSRLCERWSGNPNVSGSQVDSDRLLPFDYLHSPSQRGSDVEAKTSDMAWDSESNKLAAVLKGAGLANLGNTCFLNAVLQCFIHTVPLLRSLFSDTHAAGCQCFEEHYCVLCALREVVELSCNYNGSVVEPWKIVNNLSYFSSSFQRFQQEDAHEFLQCFLERLESCHDSKLKDCTNSERDNFVREVFGGSLVSKLKCCKCCYSSDTYEPLVNLSLEIEEADNLLMALQSFTKIEKIEDSGNKFTCENCKEQVPIEKQLMFDKAPSVATFHLKRFKNDGYFVEKIDKHIAFPLELDLLPFTCNGKPSDVELKYNLYAIVVHKGLTSTSGHYYCFIRLSPDMWCKFDDSRVVPVHEDLVMSQEAYILFYSKEGTSWFSSFMETQQFMDSNISSTSPKSVLDKVDMPTASPTVIISHYCDSIEASDATVSKYSEVQDNESKEEGPTCNIPTGDYLDLPYDPEKQVSACSPNIINRKQWDGVSGTSQTFTPQSPYRSPSPEIYREDPPDMVFSIQRNHVRSMDRVSCKRQLDKVLDDAETKQACLFIKKSIHGARGAQLLAALKESKREGSADRKKSRRSGSSPRRDNTRPLSPLLAEGFR